MSNNVVNLEVRFPNGEYGLSARRLWEHTNLDQINVFGQSISTCREQNDATRFIDVIWYSGSGVGLTGLTVFDLRSGKLPRGNRELSGTFSLEDAFGPIEKAFIKRVSAHIDFCAKRQATRNKQQNFLPSAGTDDALGISGLHSSLKRRLRSMGNTKFNSEQWRSTIANFRKKGLRAEELESSGLSAHLFENEKSSTKLLANDLADECNFEMLRLSVIPVLKDAARQLHFTATPNKKLSSTKRLPKAQDGQLRTVSQYDPVLGYRLEKVEHQTLWGVDAHWQAVTYDGQLIVDQVKKTLHLTIESAAEVAAGHAQQHFPKRVALGRWNHIAWSGGEEYREWLVTMPFFPASYFSSHFNIRNVLIHVRCDIRLGYDGERVLLLQEVQSDWAQNARRDVANGDMEPDSVEYPPFIKEWPALAMKLMLLHAAQRGAHAVAWTRGAHQAFRYKGLGASGLAELYDRTLPREVNRMMKPFGVACEQMGVFVPTNFSIRQSEAGYEVFTAENKLLGTARTLEDAREFVPDGGHELLYEVHGVRLPDTVRKSILEIGFPVWG